MVSLARRLKQLNKNGGIKEKMKTLRYSMDIIATKGPRPTICINSRVEHNIEINKKTGHRKFYMDEKGKGLRKFEEFVLEQWENNLTGKQK